MASLPFSVADLSYRMSQYSLQQPGNYSSYHDDSQSYHNTRYGYSNGSPSPQTGPSSPCSTESSPSLSTPPTSIPTSSSSSSSRLGSGYHSSNVRQQRQRALRRQTSASHLREISALVSRMVNEGDQCSISATSAANDASERSRQNSDLTSNGSSSPGPDYTAEDEDVQSMEEDDSELEPFNDTCEGFRVRESTGYVEWHCPWTSRARTSDGKRSVQKDTRARKHTRRRTQTTV